MTCRITRCHPWSLPDRTSEPVLKDVQGRSRIVSRVTGSGDPWLKFLDAHGKVIAQAPQDPLTERPGAGGRRAVKIGPLMGDVKFAFIILNPGRRRGWADAGNALEGGRDDGCRGT